MVETSPKLWQPGDVVVFRFAEMPTSVRMVHAYMGDPAGPGPQPWLIGGKIVTVNARPYRVVSDTGSVVVLYGAEGTPSPRWHLADQRYLLSPVHYRGRTLRFLYPERGYDVTLMFDGDGEPPWFYDKFFGEAGMQAGWRAGRDQLASETSQPSQPGRFRGWYVNLQTVHRMPFGFDAIDHALDIIVRPDHSWYWKDEDELEMAVAKGACTPEHAASIRAAGEEAVALIEAGASPFDGEWTGWQPPSEWLAAVESFPDGWQTISPLHEA